MMNFKIENGVAVPKFRAKYPVAELKVGQSFFVPLEKNEKSTNLRATAWSCAKRNKMKVTIRQCEGGCRIWRVK